MSDSALYLPNGNGTECAMLSFLQFNGHSIQDQIKEKVGRVKTVIPWTPERKIETTVVQHPEDEDLYRVYSKGAPEVLLTKCNIDEDERERILSEVVDGEFGKNGLRPFAYASKQLSKEEF